MRASTREEKLHDLNVRICEARGWKCDPRKTVLMRVPIVDNYPWIDPKGERRMPCDLPDHINGEKALWHCFEAVNEMPPCPSAGADETYRFLFYLRGLMVLFNQRRGTKLSSANAPSLHRALAIGVAKAIISQGDAIALMFEDDRAPQQTPQHETDTSGV